MKTTFPHPVPRNKPLDHPVPGQEIPLTVSIAKFFLQLARKEEITLPLIIQLNSWINIGFMDIVLGFF